MWSRETRDCLNSNYNKFKISVLQGTSILRAQEPRVTGGYHAGQCRLEHFRHREGSTWEHHHHLAVWDAEFTKQMGEQGRPWRPLGKAAPTHETQEWRRKLRDLSWDETQRPGRTPQGVTDVSSSRHWVRGVQRCSAAGVGAPGNLQKGRIWPGTSPAGKSSIMVWNHSMLTWPNFCGNFDPHKMSVISHSHTHTHVMHNFSYSKQFASNSHILPLNFLKYQDILRLPPTEIVWVFLCFFLKTLSSYGLVVSYPFLKTEMPNLLKLFYQTNIWPKCNYILIKIRMAHLCSHLITVGMLLGRNRWLKSKINFKMNQQKVKIKVLKHNKSPKL